MRATPGIKWLIVLLGFLCHSIYTAADSATVTTTATTTGSKDGAIATTTTATAVSTSAAATSVTTSHNNTITQHTTVQTPTAARTLPATTKNTPTGDAPGTGTTPTASVTSITAIQAVSTTSSLASTPSTPTATTAAPPSPGPVLNPQTTTVATSAYSLSTKTSNMSSQNVSEEQHRSTNSPAAQTSKAVTAVTTEQMTSTERSIKIPGSTAGLVGTTATTHLRNAGVSSTSHGTSSSTSYGTSSSNSSSTSHGTSSSNSSSTSSSTSSSNSSSTFSGTSFSVNKGVNAATTDSAVQASTATTSIRTPPSTQKFVYSHKDKLQAEEKDEEQNLRKVCQRLMESMDNGSCTLNWLIHNGAVRIQSVEINGKVNDSLAQQYYDELSEKEQIRTDNKTLIAILASCGALLIMIVILGACASHHRKPYNENQQHLTEELHTVENGYHDNPTLDVMEVQPEMLEKKMALNGEFNDSWMVPLDHLSKEDHPEEEDTHL